MSLNTTQKAVEIQRIIRKKDTARGVLSRSSEKLWSKNQDLQFDQNYTPLQVFFKEFDEKCCDLIKMKDLQNTEGATRGVLMRRCSRVLYQIT